MGEQAISDLALALLVAGSTAVGAAVGGALSAWVTLKVDERRRGDEDQRQQEREERAVVRSLRLVSVELMRISARLKAAAEDGVLDEDLPVAAWDAEQSTLAGLLVNDLWLTLAGAYGQVAITREFVASDGQVQMSVADSTLEAVDDAKGASLEALRHMELPAPIEDGTD